MEVGTLDDGDLAADIALLGEVMAAVAAASRELTDSEVDEVLGVGPVPTVGADPADPALSALADLPDLPAPVAIDETRSRGVPRCDRARNFLRPATHGGGGAGSVG